MKFSGWTVTKNFWFSSQGLSGHQAAFPSPTDTAGKLPGQVNRHSMPWLPRDMAMKAADEQLHRTDRVYWADRRNRQPGSCDAYWVL
jgi:hypothetical protein